MAYLTWGLDVTSIYQKIPGFCRRGLHEMTEANTKVNSKGWKICIACRRAAWKRDEEKNRETRREYRKAWRNENSEKMAEYRKASYRKIRAAIDEYKLGNPCTDCNQTFPTVCMDFDHVRGTKRYNIGLAKTLQDLADEIAKCELVCANCHRIRTHVRSE